MLMLVSCAGNKKPDRVILKHPVTQEFVNCNVNRWQSEKSYKENEECVRKYQKEGYIIWGQK